MKLRASLIFIVLISAGIPTLFAVDWKPTTLPDPVAAPPARQVWYRCFIRVPAKLVTPAAKDLWRDSLTLNLGGIHGPFVVYLNTQIIAEADDVPEGPRRRFKVPKGILEKD